MFYPNFFPKQCISLIVEVGMRSDITVPSLSSSPLLLNPFISLLSFLLFLI